MADNFDAVLDDMPAHYYLNENGVPYRSVNVVEGAKKATKKAWRSHVDGIQKSYDEAAEEALKRRAEAREKTAKKLGISSDELNSILG